MVFQSINQRISDTYLTVFTRISNFTFPFFYARSISCYPSCYLPPVHNPLTEGVWSFFIDSPASPRKKWMNINPFDTFSSAKKLVIYKKEIFLETYTQMLSSTSLWLLASSFRLLPLICFLRFLHFLLHFLNKRANLHICPSSKISFLIKGIQS